MSLRKIKDRWMLRFGVNPFDHMLKQVRKRGGTQLLLCWNRGLGDIAVGLYALVYRALELIPNLSITVATRQSLAIGFSLLENVTVLALPDIKRGQQISIPKSLQKQFDLVITDPDPTLWAKWQLGTLIPKLKMPSSWTLQEELIPLSPHHTYIGVHVDAESGYAPWRNWPLSHWKKLFTLLQKHQDVEILLFGFTPCNTFEQMPHVIDLRGKTTIPTLFSLITKHCRILIAPDSGVATITYFLEDHFDLTLISLWARKDMGILKQNVPSPNPFLEHIPLMAPHSSLDQLVPESVYETIVSLWQPR